MSDPIYRIPMFEPLPRWSIMTTLEFFDTCSLIRQKTLDAIHPRHDALLEAADAMLLLHDEIRQMWITIQGLETWIADVLRPDDPPLNIRAEWRKYNTVEIVGLYAAYTYRASGIDEMPNPNYVGGAVSTFELHEAHSMARALWEECPSLASDFESSCLAFQKSMKKHEQRFVNIYHHWQVMSGFICSAHTNTMCAYKLLLDLKILNWEDVLTCREVIGVGKSEHNVVDAAMDRLDEEFLRDLLVATELTPRYRRAIWQCNGAMKTGNGERWTRKSTWKMETGTNWTFTKAPGEKSLFTVSRKQYDALELKTRVAEKDEWIDVEVLREPKPRRVKRRPKMRRTKRKKKTKPGRGVTKQKVKILTRRNSI